MTAQPRALVFDLDGTLVDSSAMCSAILQQMIAARGFGHVIDPDHARRFMSFGGERMVEALLGEALVDVAHDLAEFRRHYRAMATPPGALFAGVSEGIAALAGQGFALAICSNKPQELCEKVLADTGLESAFAAVVGSQPGIPAKPAPDLLDHALALLGATPAEAIYIGDSEVDHQTAAARAVPFWLVRYGYAAPGWDPADCRAFDDFSALTAALLPAATAISR